MLGGTAAESHLTASPMPLGRGRTRSLGVPSARFSGRPRDFLPAAHSIVPRSPRGPRDLHSTAALLLLGRSDRKGIP